MSTLTSNSNFVEGVDTDAIGSSAPAGNIGFEKGSGQTGFFIYSTTEYTLWLKNSFGTWIAHQAFTAQNLLVSTTFAWEDYEAAYIQTASPGHKVYVYPRTGNLLVDSDTSDNVNEADTLVTAGTSSSIDVIGTPVEQFPSWSSVNGHIIPDSNAAFDIGSAEYKVRHLFLSDNSLWIGNNQKLSVSGGKLKMQNRKSGDVPQFILDSGATPQDFANYYPGRTAASISLPEWVTFAKDFTGNQQLKTTQVITAADFDDAADWEDYLLVGDPVTGDLTLKAPDEKTATLSEIREAIDNKHTFTDHIVLKEKRDLHFYDETDSMKGEVSYNENVSGNFIKVGLEADDTKARTISLNAGNTDGISPEGTVKLIGRTLIDRDGSLYDVTDKIDSVEGDVATNAAAIAAIDTSGIATNATAIAAIDTSGIATNATAIADLGDKHAFSHDGGGDLFGKHITFLNDDGYSRAHIRANLSDPAGLGTQSLEIAVQNAGNDITADKEIILNTTGRAGLKTGDGEPEGEVKVIGKLKIYEDATNTWHNVVDHIHTTDAALATNATDIAANATAIATEPISLRGEHLTADYGARINTSNLNGGMNIYGEKSGNGTLAYIAVNTIGGNSSDGDIQLIMQEDKNNYHADNMQLSMRELVFLLRNIKTAVANSTDGDTLRGQLLLAFANWDV